MDAAAIKEIIAQLSVNQLPRLPSEDDVGAQPFLISPVDGKPISLEPLLGAPLRTRRVIKLRNIPDFIAYVSKYKQDNAQAFATRSSSGADIEAILDHFEPGETSWLDHRVTLALENTPSFTAWKAHNGKLMGQVEFAEFIEDHLDDIIEPTSSDLLRCVTTFKTTTSAEFDQKVSLANGSSHFSYREDVRGVVQAGVIDVPQKIRLVLEPFRGMDKGFEVEANIRYRVGKDGLQIGYKIPAIDRVIDKAVTSAIELVKTGTDIDVYE